jgi:GNAT superfamily N-acetyltransferase
MLDDILEDEFPKEGTLEDGTAYIIRLLTSDDADLLYTFFQGIPREDRMFLRDDVSDKSVIDGWCQEMDYEIVIPIVAEVDGAIACEGSLHRERRGWMSHIGKVRIAVHPDYRRRGIAAVVMQELIEVALHTGSVEQVVSECMVNQEGAIRMCENAGFVQRAVLPDYVRDLEGDRHDLVLLSYALRDGEFYGLD